MRCGLFILWLLCSGDGWAQTFDQVVNGDTSNANPSTLTINVPSNSNRVMYIFHAMQGTTNSCTTSSADFNGSAATKIGEVGSSTNAGADYAYASMWRLIAPATGSHTVTANISSCTFDGYTRIIAFSIYNVNQTTPEGTCATTSATTGTSSSINVTSASGDLVIDGLSATGAPTTTAGGSQTDQSAGLNRIDGSTLTASGASTTMSWSISGGTFGHAQIGCAVKPVTSANHGTTLATERLHQ